MKRTALCIDNSNVSRSLTKGAIYEVIDFGNLGITVIDNSGMNTVYERNRFKLIDEEETIKEEPKDNVNHPSHYTNGKYECIDILQDITKDLTGLEAVCTAHAVKYLWRWKYKNGVEDLKKANWYINKLIETIEQNK